MNDFIKTNLFSCPIYKIRIDPNSYDKEKIINDILYNKSLKNTRNNYRDQKFRSTCDIHHSYKDFDDEESRSINYEKLIVVYSKIFEEFFNKELYTTKKFNYNFEIINFSARSTGLGDQIDIYKNLIKKYNVDYVFLFITDNDFLNNHYTDLDLFRARYKIINNEVVKMFAEPGKNDTGTDSDPFEVSDADTMLKYLQEAK